MTGSSGAKAPWNFRGHSIPTRLKLCPFTSPLQHLGPGQLDLGGEPGTAGGDLDGVGLLVNAALAPRLPLEVLDDVGGVTSLRSRPAARVAPPQPRLGKL